MIFFFFFFFLFPPPLLQACKYVPFGPIEYVVPYLVRRLQENSGLVGRAADERALMKREIIRRLTEK